MRAHHVLLLSLCLLAAAYAVLLFVSPAAAPIGVTLTVVGVLWALSCRGCRVLDNGLPTWGVFRQYDSAMCLSGYVRPMKKRDTDVDIPLSANR